MNVTQFFPFKKVISLGKARNLAKEPKKKENAMVIGNLIDFKHMPQKNRRGRKTKPAQSFSFDQGHNAI